MHRPSALALVLLVGALCASISAEERVVSSSLAFATAWRDETVTDIVLDVDLTVEDCHYSDLPYQRRTNLTIRPPSDAGPGEPLASARVHLGPCMGMR
jgi:hypothetical protein